MHFIHAGTFWMGSDDYYAEESPARQVSVGAFWIDEAPITNRQFSDFVDATGHVTTAERQPDPDHYPEADPARLRAGSALFVPPDHPVPLTDVLAWWHFCFGADWRHPGGPDTGIESMAAHPVVHVAFADVHAYAEWAGKSLPTEAEWEYAARGGLQRKAYAWGDELEPDGAMMANYWQGVFPFENLRGDGHARTSPVGSYPANGFGLYDMIGNVWEWTSDWYAVAVRGAPAAECCMPGNRRGGSEPGGPPAKINGSRFGRKVVKGGSHLCAANYCQRYRPAARYAQTIDTSTSHLGFRCVRRA